MPIVSFRPIILAVVVASAASACVAEDEPANELSLYGGGFGYVGNQGRLLQGFKAPDWRVFSFTNMTGVRVIADGQLVSDQATGASMKNAIISGGGFNMRIVEAQSPQSLGDRWQYRLEQQDPSSGLWSPACDEPNLVLPPADPPASPPYAFAMNGWVWYDGGIISSNSQVTFACTTGVMAKAVKWGYGTDTQWSSITENGTYVGSVTGFDMMQAASRMARADYCGQGLTNTLDGTPIFVDDVYRNPGAIPQGFAFEAAWPGRAAKEYNAVNHDPVVCLSKLRWSTLPLGGYCPLTLPDPRVNVKASFCDDLLAQPTLMEAGLNGKPGARTYSYTTFLDAGLYNYNDLNTRRRLATTHLQPQVNPALPAWIPSSPGVGFPAQSEDLWLDATIFQAALPPEIQVSGLRMLSSYNCGSDLVTTTSGSTCPKMFDEGQLYPVNTPGRANLRRWTDTQGYSFTTTASPWSMLYAGNQLVEVLGGVIRGQNDVNLRWGTISGATYTLDVAMRSGELITNCLTTTSTTATLFAPRHGQTPTCASGRAIDHNDIASLTLTATGPTVSYTRTVTYDGFSNDVYFQLGKAAPTAIHLSWTNLGPKYQYSVRLNDEKCLAYEDVRTDLSRVLYRKCPSGLAIRPSSVDSLTVCAKGPFSEKCYKVPSNKTWSQFVPLSP